MRCAYRLFEWGIGAAFLVTVSLPAKGESQDAPATVPIRWSTEKIQLLKKSQLLKNEVIKLEQQATVLPGNDVAVLTTAQVLSSKGETLKAIALLQSQLQKGSAAPVQDELRLLLGRLLVDEHLDADALQVLDPLARRQNSELQAALANEQLLRLHYRNENYSHAVSAFLKIRNRLPPPELAQAMYKAGNSYMQLKEFLKAVEVLDRVPPQSEMYPFAVYSSGLSYLSIGDSFSSTQLRFQKLLDLDLGEDRTLHQLIEKTHATLGYLFIEQKRFTEALIEFGRVPETSPYADQARFGLGWTYIGMGECVRAIVAFDDLIQTYPYSRYSLEAWLNIGACYSKLNAYNKAAERYRQALEAYSRHRQMLKTVTDQIRSGTVKDWMDRSAAAPAPSGGSAPADPTGWIWRDLMAQRETIELAELYRDLERLGNHLGSKAQSGASEALRARWKTVGAQPAVLQKELEKILRQTLEGRIGQDLQQLQELGLQANIGVAKSLSSQAQNVGP
jgi:tetratricopeptide (TPR) repeat protein